MHIVKLGGSLYETAELVFWLKLLADTAMNDSVVIVPGGGPFADTVREAQSRHKFDDQHAHHMALLAMAQYGILLHAFLPSAVLINTPAEVSNTCQLSIWLPDAQLLQVDELIPSWHITSDSLALWFAQQLPNSQLSLIKRINPNTGDITVLTEKGIIDQGFNSLFKRQPLPAQLIHYQTPNQFPDNGLVLK